MKGLGRFLAREGMPAQAAALESGHRSMETFLTEFQASGGAVSSSDYMGAWGIPAAWRASTLLGGLIGGLPLHGYRKVQGRQPVCLDPTPVVLETPTPGRTTVEVLGSWVYDYLHHGNAVGVVASRDPVTGWPTSLVPVPATWVSVTALENLTAFDFATLGGAMAYRIGSQVFGPRDVFHVRGPCMPGALRGVGVLEAALRTFTLATEQRDQASGLATHGVPTGLLYASDPDVSREELAAGKASWLAAQTTRTIAALPPGVEFKAISWNPEEMQLVEARRMSTQDMALLYGLPGSLLNVESGSWNYSNVGQDGLNLLKFTVDLILKRFEQEWTRHLPRGTSAKFNRDAVLETDLLTLYQTLGQAPWMTDDEKRARTGLDPLPKPITPPAPPVPPTSEEEE